MDSQRMDTRREDEIDLSALAWVQDELRRSLDAAHKALRRFVKESQALADSDVDAVDPSVLRSARQQIHQGVGALELVGLPSAAQVLRASEALVQRFVGRPQKFGAPVVDAIEQSSFALLDYLSRRVAGKDVSPLSMFPQYRAVQELAGAERVHPADLWDHDWRWLALPDDPNAPPLQPDPKTERAVEQHLLALMRSPAGTRLTAALDRLSQLCAGLGAGAGPTHTATLWKLAAAVFEAQSQGLLRPDVFSKRVASRLLAQFRVLQGGQPEVSERLAQDLLFFCAQAESPGSLRRTPRLTAVREAYGLTRYQPVDYHTSVLGRFDPALIAQARKRVASAKDAWGAVAGGELQRLGSLAEQFSLVGESLKRLYPGGELLANELQGAIAQTQQSGAGPQPPLAMEVATGLLYLDASLDDGDFDHPQQADRVRRLADRVAGVRAGQPPRALEDWMEELYRRVSDRQTMGSVVQELRASLSESEKLIDQYFRAPVEPQVLIPVPGQLSAMRGVLSVLGLDHASQAVVRMRDDVNALLAAEGEVTPAVRSGTFDRLAGNLGALGFLIDMFSVQPQMAKSLFAFDAERGTLDPLMGRPQTRQRPGEVLTVAVAPRLIEQAQTLAFSSARHDVPVEEVTRGLEELSHEALAADQPALAATVSNAQAALESAHDAAAVDAARAHLSEALVDFVFTASGPMPLEPELAAFPASAPPVPAPAGPADLAEDDEMREIFLEEAREVLESAHAARGELVHEPADLGQLTTLRRAFHTLKGSSRMVGLRDFGEAAWVCEQVFNTWLAEQRPADPPLLAFTSEALDELGRWVQAIGANAPADRHQVATLQAAADRLTAPALPDAVEALDDLPPELRELGLDLPLESEPQTESVPDLASMALPADLPSAEDLDFTLDFGTEASEPPVAQTPSVEPVPELPAVEAAAAPAPPPGGDVESQEWLEPFDVRATEPMALDVSFELDPDATWADAPAREGVSQLIDLDVATPQPAADPAATRETAEAEGPAGDDEQIKRVGPLRIGIPLFNIYLAEADELSRRLSTELAEWAMELHRPVGENAVALAHSLAGSSATVGFADLSQLARSLEHSLMRSHERGRGEAAEATLFVDVAEDIRRLLHQFAAGFLKTPPPELLERLAAHEAEAVRRMDARSHADAAGAPVSEPGALLLEAPIVAEPESVDSAPVFEPVPELEPEPVAVDALPNPEPTDSHFAGLGLTEFKPLEDLAPEPQRLAPRHGDASDAADEIDAIDAVDAELFPIFEEEGQELLPQLAAKLREWVRRPTDSAAPAAAMRTLHTLKGGARLAGAMRLGEMCHRLETGIERVLANAPVQAVDVEALQSRGDALTAVFEALRSHDAQAYAEATEAAAAQAAAPLPLAVTPLPPVPSGPAVPIEAVPAEPAAVPASESSEPHPPVADLPAIDWSRFPAGASEPQAAERAAAAPSQSAVRVRAPLLDRMVNQAGEVSITRTRIEADVGLIRSSLSDLNDNLERLRQQLRDLELQTETQMSSRLEAAKAAAEAFDPLELDRYTRFQELTRMMAESVNDVATVQRTLQRAVEGTEDELAAQARLTRDLQDDLLRTRMVEFEGQADRLYRVVRQAAKETGKQVRLDIVGGSIELDRGVLDRMTGAFEHLLRNCVTHGIEAPEARTAAGKDATGDIVVALHQEGNEVAVEVRDDGAGLDLARIREKGIALGLIGADAQVSDAELANLIFTPGFSTASSITELAGRGVGMDVVRSDVSAMGGRIETATAAGKGTSFKLVLPLTTAVTQVVMLCCGDVTVAVPSTLVEIVRRASQDEIEQAYASGSYTVGDRVLPFFWLGALLQTSARGTESGRTRSVVVIRSAQQRIALHVDDVLGNQEAVVKNLGPQLSRLPGLAGMTLLASGAVAMIYNPVALATLYGESARALTQASLRAPDDAAPADGAPKSNAAPLVLVVDDSLTVRRVTQRLLVREGYRVTVAKDGLDALEKLAEEKPQVVLSDIEMPRMDGFDLVRNIRGDARLADLPVIMITSRIAQKHRDVAAQLGVEHYLGKPYSEEDLLALIGRYTGSAATANA